MLERAFRNCGRGYWLWLAFLLAAAAMGFHFYMRQFAEGLGITGLSRDVSWGLYIGQFTFFVGVAASSVMVVLPHYLHGVKAFGRITVLGEFLAVGAVVMCLLFVMIDMGMPTRLFNVLIYATPTSPLFWDMNGYLVLNLITGWNVLEAEYKGAPVSGWVKPLIYLSIPWAFSIHTVTAFIYSGLPGRDFWLTALTAPKFLASAFATGPALLILLCFILKRAAGFDAGQQAIRRLALIQTYAMIITVFMVAVEFFTAYYSQVPGHVEALDYLFFGSPSHSAYVGLMRLFAVLSLAALILLINRGTRENEKTLLLASVCVFAAMLIEKGISFVPGGFVNHPFGQSSEYLPTLPEAGIIAGVWAIGALTVSLFYRVVVAVKADESQAPDALRPEREGSTWASRSLSS
ncbi:sulfate reduction electron transfer complex DsrMKJOP subunit DsrP [Acetonema longum]|uniref:Polysulphide reductase, NrfD n=1 Tax=Acetonema longum DSM 6540 TaxID=1009370 RepID=F7NFF6_9FIRM|nr:NrfD/PsrC family molybdoenzyme membrane anchor subunit [Acetonema longum]EGO65211.1 polysulphide reductase, NrfD [Acetonema longum DSM 6540]